MCALQLVGMETGLMERIMLGLMTLKDEVEFNRQGYCRRTPPGWVEGQGVLGLERV